MKVAMRQGRGRWKLKEFCVAFQAYHLLQKIREKIVDMDAIFSEYLGFSGVFFYTFLSTYYVGERLEFNFFFSIIENCCYHGLYVLIHK